MRRPPHVPELERDSPALGMNGVGDPPPAAHLLGIVDAGVLIQPAACDEMMVASVMMSPAEARWR